MNRRIVTVLVSSLFAPSGMLTAAEFFDLGLVCVGSVSADGTVVVGGTETGKKEAFIWTRQNGMRTLGAPGDSYASEASFDGTVVTGGMGDGGLGSPSQLFLWNEVDGLTGLGAPPGFSNIDLPSISADGRTVAGRSYNFPIYDFDAWRWTAEDGFVSLGRPDGATSVWANDISADGKVIVGTVLEATDFDPLWGISSPFLWTEENGFQDLGLLPQGWQEADASRVSLDGRTVAGAGRDDPDFFSSPVFRWTSEEGMQPIPPLPGTDLGLAPAMTADGSMIAGGFYNIGSGDRLAFVWDEEHGTRDLRDVLIAEHGFADSQLPALHMVRGLSADGTVIVGNSFPCSPSWAIYLDKPLVSFDTDQLQPGDADQDLDFDQLDLVQVQQAAKYLTGQSATWGEGDWNGAPGGSPGSPPAGDGLFNQFDIVAAQQGAAYLTGPYAAIQAGGQQNDGQTSVVYNPSTGEVAVDAPSGTELTSINIDSASSIFTGQAAANLGGSFDNDADNNIFKATFGGSFGSVSFGNVAQTGLSEDFVLGDLTVIGSLAGGGDLGNVDLVYVPEPPALALLAFGLLFCVRRLRCAT